MKKKKVGLQLGDVEALWMEFNDEWLTEQKLPKKFKHISEIIEAVLEWARETRFDRADEIESLASDISSIATDIGEEFWMETPK